MNQWTASQLDVFLKLQFLTDRSISLVVTDPAYESLEKHRAKGTTTRLKHSKASSNDWFPIFKNQDYPRLFRELYRVLEKNAHCYVFSDQESMFVMKPAAEAAGFKFWKPIVWDKVAIGMGYHYRARYEFILFFEKGKRKLNDLGVPDILTAKRIRNGFPTEKPWELSKTLIEQSSNPHDVVLDPFMGSGSVGEAALRTGRRFLGSDVTESAVKFAARRLECVEKELQK